MGGSLTTFPQVVKVLSFIPARRNACTNARGRARLARIQGEVARGLEDEINYPFGLYAR